MELRNDLECLYQKLKALSQKEGVKVIALDGRSASGKTTLANHLQERLGAGVIHMDDFFLPAELRTPERLSEPGGNVHYERFIDEIIPHIKKTNKFTYRCFECARMSYGIEKIVSESEWRIVEGSYSCHPILGEYMDLRVFCDISSEEQMRRIQERNGEQKAEIFRTRWIPMEEYYFQEMKIREKAEVIV